MRNVENVTLKYVKAGTPYEQEINVVWVKGFDDFDKARYVNAMQKQCVNGKIVESINGFQREFEIYFGVVSSAAERRAILYFLLSNIRSVWYQGIQLAVGKAEVYLDDVQSYENEWLFGFKNARAFKIVVIERRVRQVFPEVFPAIEDAMSYIVKHVKIEGTEFAPELFTTNSGKLQYNYSAVQLPAIDLDTQIVTIQLSGYQSAFISQIGVETQNGNDIDFYLAVSASGNASDDGYFYADITFTIQDKT